MKHRTIRSTAQRQILTWLRHGPSTVSEIAEQFSMRMPHASLACRQLREAGLITRDERGGLRNAPIYLSQGGMDRLVEDAVGKMQQHAALLRTSARSHVLHADENNVLLAYIEPPESSFVYIGETPEAEDGNSSGNPGGTWVLAPTSSIQWFSLNEGTPIDPPAPREASTLAAFESTPQRVGLVRGVVVEQRGHHALLEGQPFDALSQHDAPPPAGLSVGEIEIGSVPGLTGGFAPSPGLLGHLRSASHRNLLLNALSRGALVLSDRQGASNAGVPFSVLSHWLTFKHPRMATHRRQRLYDDLVRELQTSATPDASPLMRSLLMDFGDQPWTMEPWRPGPVNLHGITERGVLSILHHAMEEGRLPFVVDWAFETPSSPRLSRWLRHPDCRSVILRRDPPPEGLPSTSLLVDGHDLGTVAVHLSRSIRFDLTLHLGETEPPPSQQHDVFIPATATELLDATSVGKAVYSEVAPAGVDGQRWREALRLYPLGDEERANALEPVAPLLAWVASPPASRPARWVRLHRVLPAGWVELMDVHDVPLADLPYALSVAGTAWRRRALHHLQSQTVEDLAAVLRWRQQLTDDAAHRPALAASILCALDPTKEHHRALFEEASDAWFEAPMSEREVLESLFGRWDPTEGEGLLQRWVERSMLQPKGSMLRAWATGLEIAQRREPWLPETQRRLMELLPSAWWSMFAQSWLLGQLNSHTGRMWLASSAFSWPALVARTPGERVQYPGLADEHPAFDLSSTALLPVNLLPDGPGKPALEDLYAMVNALDLGAPVPVLSTHPMAGWLVRPVHQWPVFGSEVLTMGDPMVGEVLFLRSYHARHLRPLR